MFFFFWSQSAEAVALEYHPLWTPLELARVRMSANLGEP